LLVGQAARDQAQDVGLTMREDFMPAHQTDHPSGRLGRQCYLARACPTNGPQQFVDPGILEEVRGCPGPNRLDGRGVLVDAGHDDDLGVL
jgi:hypothetical protein